MNRSVQPSTLSGCGPRLERADDVVPTAIDAPAAFARSRDALARFGRHLVPLAVNVVAARIGLGDWPKRVEPNVQHDRREADAACF